jgi:hypothetical protein
MLVSNKVEKRWLSINLQNNQTLKFFQYLCVRNFSVATPQLKYNNYYNGNVQNFNLFLDISESYYSIRI